MLTQYELWTRVPKYIQARVDPNELLNDLTTLNAIELIKIKGVSKCKIKSERLLNEYYQSFYQPWPYRLAKRLMANARSTHQSLTRCLKRWTTQAAR